MLNERLASNKAVADVVMQSHLNSLEKEEQRENE
jgi:hypothetical protein